ncbi:MAG TPA: L-histidine N(alpha)-methyltransferase [Thermoleophilaceae bacterium]|nr:L-histidine N(alpha)-methyltransferase [Thermoleophilaceae bacterium]
MTGETLTDSTIEIDSYLEGSSLDSMADEVRAGLTRDQKELPPKYFYDERGSELFDRITELPEYYPTRCERAILNRRAPVIVDLAEATELVELGSGSASKTRALLFAMAGSGMLERYLPVDVSESVVERSAEELAEIYPGLHVHGVVGDFERHLGLVPVGERPLVAFLGGTIGNFYPESRARFLARVRELLGSEGRFLVGTDLVKDVRIVEAAYNDSAGVTAEFNRNVLHAINRELGADFDPGAFEHVAAFDREHSWIEMRLRALGEQHVSIPGAGLELTFADGEEIRTEISTKFTQERLAAELSRAGMQIEAFFTDADSYFAVTLAAPA